jgi:hypothetical protein
VGPHGNRSRAAGAARARRRLIRSVASARRRREESLPYCSVSRHRFLGCHPRCDPTSVSSRSGGGVRRMPHAISPTGRLRAGAPGHPGGGAGDRGIVREDSTRRLNERRAAAPVPRALAATPPHDPAVCAESRRCRNPATSVTGPKGLGSSGSSRIRHAGGADCIQAEEEPASVGNAGGDDPA